MIFHTEKITLNDSIRYGSDDAPVKIIEYINLCCPDSLAYEQSIAPFLEDFIKKGQVQRVLKHFDKNKSGLRKGNILNTYINYDDQNEAFTRVHQLFTRQGEWGNGPEESIGEIAGKYGLIKQTNHKERSKCVMNEIKSVGIERIPTIFIGDESFVESVDPVRFVQVLIAKIEQKP